MRFATFVSIAVVFSFVGTSNAQLTFNFTAESGTPQFVIDGFNEAGALWSRTLSDSVTVDINIDYRSISGGAIGITTPTVGTEIYSDFRRALIGDAKSAADFSSSSALQTKPTGLTAPLDISFDVWSNRSVENPNGAGSSTPYLDKFDLTSGPSNNVSILYTSANARAIGIDTGSLPDGDGSITFSSDVMWDFDRSDGITGGLFDFVGVAAHEIGHVLGFTSGVSNIDAVSSGSENDNEFLSNPLDLFRFSSDSLANGAGVQDMTVNDTAKFFSIDGGATSLAGFSLGANSGDGFQADHWKFDTTVNVDGMDVLPLMLPFLLPGNELVLTELDRTAFDVIGWDLTAVPEPGSLMLLLFGLAGFAMRRSRS